MATVIGSILAAVAGLVGGRLLVAGVGRLVEPSIPTGSRAMLWTPVVAAAAALALWWWEVLCRGLVPEGADASLAMLATRFALHGTLFLLLAAATWVDLRHRIIPDAITVPGVLAGLAALAAWPDGLLPVIREVPRSFALPLREADVLGFVGPLRGPWPTWLEPAPSLAGLAIAIVAFTVWWLVGTEPGVSETRMGAWWRRLVAPRPLVAITGAGVVVTAWLVGGDHWRGLVSALGGLAVSAGMVWLTRAGASRALGREAMGLGDVTLMAMVGAWLGWSVGRVLGCAVGGEEGAYVELRAQQPQPVDLTAGEAVDREVQGAIQAARAPQQVGELQLLQPVLQVPRGQRWIGAALQQQVFAQAAFE